MSEITVSKSALADLEAVLALYRRVASVPGGLAREADEIDEAYVRRFLENASATGVGVIAKNDGRVVGEIHCYALGPRCFAHVLGELTIAVDPDFQGRGVGRMIFSELLRVVREERPGITRVELIARESNAKAIAFYESLGFAREGRLEARIASAGTGGFEADIPMAWRRG